MSARSELEKRIEKKREEIKDLRAKVRDAEVYISALEDALKVLPREGVNDGDAESVLRPGGSAAEARLAILANGGPLHIDALLEAMDKDVTRANRTSVSGAISAYVRRGEIFTRPAPNTFGLCEMPELRAAAEQPNPFGSDVDVGISDDDVPF